MEQAVLPAAPFCLLRLLRQPVLTKQQVLLLPLPAAMVDVAVHSEEPPVTQMELTVAAAVPMGVLFW